MIRCRTCCLPDTKPDLVFVDGQCSACISYEKRAKTDWSSRGQDLLRLLDRFDGRVIVPSSGGKDSTYIAMRMKQLGADVTAVTATTCHLTPVGRSNLNNLAKHVRTIEVTSNMTTRALLNRLGLQLVGDISWPEHASIFSVPFRMAQSLGIGLLMYGENPQEAYGGPMGSDEAREMTRRWVSEFGGFNGLRPQDFIGMEGITERDMLDYMLPLSTSGIEAHFLGAYEEWDSHRNAEVAIACGMSTFRGRPPTRSNWWIHENLDNCQTGIHDLLMFKKYGYGRGCAQISVDVRMGRIKREEALSWVAVNDGQFPHHYCGVELGEVLERVSMTRAELLAVCWKFSAEQEAV